MQTLSPPLNLLWHCRGCSATKPGDTLASPSLIHSLRVSSSIWQQTSQAGNMTKAAISLAFHGLLRASEFTSPTTVSYNPKKTLLKSDITIRHHTIRVQIKTSKTDQRGHGQTILLGCTNSSTCPISLIEQYLEASHHPFPHLPLFHFTDGRLLMRYSLATSLKECILAVGENPKHFSTHSLRIGGATAVAAAGITPSIIQELGRWQSNCFRHYT